jgi:hypothetical protein
VLRGRVRGHVGNNRCDGVLELNGAEADERVDERAAAFWAEKKAWLEEVAATVQKATVERAVASSGIPHESKMATPVAMRVPDSRVDLECIRHAFGRGTGRA